MSIVFNTSDHKKIKYNIYVLKLIGQLFVDVANEFKDRDEIDISVPFPELVILDFLKCIECKIKDTKFNSNDLISLLMFQDYIRSFSPLIKYKYIKQYVAHKSLEDILKIPISILKAYPELIPVCFNTFQLKCFYDFIVKENFDVKQYITYKTTDGIVRNYSIFIIWAMAVNKRPITDIEPYIESMSSSSIPVPQSHEIIKPIYTQYGKKIIIKICSIISDNNSTRELLLTLID